jgi:hypothetical protein
MVPSDRYDSSLCTTRGLYSVPVYFFLAWLLMMIRPTMLGLAVRGSMAASYMRHEDLYSAPACTPSFRDYLWWADRLCWD